MAAVYLCSLCNQRSAIDGFCLRDGVVLLPSDGALAIGGYLLVRFLEKGRHDASQLWLVKKGDEPAILQLFVETIQENPSWQQAVQRAKLLRGRVIHPAFPQILEAGTYEGHPFVVSEKIEGTPLDKIVAKRAFTEGEALRLGVHLLNALDCLHRFELPPDEQRSLDPYRVEDRPEKGFWHGRFYLSNLVLTPSGALRFINLGHTSKPRPYSRSIDQEEQRHIVLGGEGQPRHLFDIYLVALIISRLWKGPPEEAGPILGVCDDARPAEGLLVITMRAARLAPSERYASAAEMMRDVLVRLGATNPSFAVMYLDEAVQFVQDSAARNDLLSIAQLLAARPDLCVESWFTAKLWELLGDRLSGRLWSGAPVDSIDWALWVNIPDARYSLLAALTRPDPEANTLHPARVTAAQLLGYHQGVGEALVEAMNSPYPELREAAAASLAKVSAAPPVTHGGNQVKIVPCSQRWDMMTPLSADDSSRMCQKCQAPVVKVTNLEDLKKIAGRGCAIYNPNVQAGAAKRALKDLYTIRAPLRPPPLPPLLTTEERPADPLEESLRVGLSNVRERVLAGDPIIVREPERIAPLAGAIAHPGMPVEPRVGLLQRILRFFRRE